VKLPRRRSFTPSITISEASFPPPAGFIAPVATHPVLSRPFLTSITVHPFETAERLSLALVRQEVWGNVFPIFRRFFFVSPLRRFVDLISLVALG
jgi:hypothetical protein